MRYQIENTRSGVILGVYEAASKRQAMDLYAQDAGYDDYAHLDDEIPARKGEIIVLEVRDEID